MGASRNTRPASAICSPKVTVCHLGCRYQSEFDFLAAMNDPILPPMTVSSAARLGRDVIRIPCLRLPGAIQPPRHLPFPMLLHGPGLDHSQQPRSPLSTDDEHVRAPIAPNPITPIFVVMSVAPFCYSSLCPPSGAASRPRPKGPRVPTVVQLIQHTLPSADTPMSLRADPNRDAVVCGTPES